jgi:hypothetical protein
VVRRLGVCDVRAAKSAEVRITAAENKALYGEITNVERTFALAQSVSPR